MVINTLLQGFSSIGLQCGLTSETVARDNVQGFFQAELQALAEDALEISTMLKEQIASARYDVLCLSMGERYDRDMADDIAAEGGDDQANDEQQTVFRTVELGLSCWERQEPSSTPEQRLVLKPKVLLYETVQSWLGSLELTR